MSVKRIDRESMCAVLFTLAFSAAFYVADRDILWGRMTYITSPLSEFFSLNFIYTYLVCNFD
jgi:hypothetical protein